MSKAIYNSICNWLKNFFENNCSWNNRL